MLALLGLPLALAFGGCAGDLIRPNGACSLDTALDCSVSGVSVNLDGYSCTGTARPDDNAHYYDGVPRGQVCANHGAPEGGKQSYCCSKAEALTSCALDPVNSCVGGTYGYQCRGASRPDVYNPAVSCGQGVRDVDYVNYCCAGGPPQKGCDEGATFSPSCDARLLGFTCAPGLLPLGSDLVRSESHADNFYFLCPVGELANNGVTMNYCCFMAAPPPEGYSCVQHTTVPGCKPRQFGFACTGVDTPDQDYPPMLCNNPGVPGTSVEGYPATLYCCDLKPPPTLN